MSDKKSYTSPKIEIRDSRNGKGLFVTEKINKGEIVIDFTNGPGKFISTEESYALYKNGNDYMLQVDDDKHFVAQHQDELEIADFINHSCNPNCGLRGSKQIVAMRNIKPGEEIAFDYAMSESSRFEMACNCGSKNCRHIITGDDWKNKGLQKKYRGFFSDYLRRKIDNQK